MTNIITYLKPVLFMRKVFGTVLILFGLFAIVFVSAVLGAIALVMGINIVSTQGSQIDITGKLYRNVWSLYGINFGKWEPLPECEYVSVFRTNEFQTVRVVTAETTLKNEVFMLNIFYGNKHISAYKTTDKENAFKVANHLKIALNIDVLDATGEEKIWL